MNKHTLKKAEEVVMESCSCKHPCMHHLVARRALIKPVAQLLQTQQEKHNAVVEGLMGIVGKSLSGMPTNDYCQYTLKALDTHLIEKGINLTEK